MAAVPNLQPAAHLAPSTCVQQLDLSTTATVSPAAQRAAWRKIQALLERAQALDCQRLHVEPDALCWRLRFRTADAFSEEIISDPSALLWAMEVLQARLWGNVGGESRRAWFATPLNGTAYIVQADAVPATSGDTLLFTLLPDLPAPPRLDELELTPSQSRKIREMLAKPNGWIAIACADSTARAITLQAITQEVTAPDIKTLCIEPTVHPVLARATQLTLDANSPEERLANWQAALQLDSDFLILGTDVPDDYLPPLFVKARSSRVVQGLNAHGATRALQQLRAQGMTMLGLAEDLTGIIVQQRLRTLCPHCKEIATLNDEAREWLNTQLTPAAVDISRWLDDGATHRYLTGAGCDNCYDTGFAGTSNAFDVLAVNENLRNVLRSEDTENSEAVLSSSQQMHLQVMTMARRGETSLDEAMRVVRSIK